MPPSPSFLCAFLHPFLSRRLVCHLSPGRWGQRSVCTFPAPSCCQETGPSCCQETGSYASRTVQPPQLRRPGEQVQQCNVILPGPLLLHKPYEKDSCLSWFMFPVTLCSSRLFVTVTKHQARNDSKGVILLSKCFSSCPGGCRSSVFCKACCCQRPPCSRDKETNKACFKWNCRWRHRASSSQTVWSVPGLRYSRARVKRVRELREQNGSFGLTTVFAFWHRIMFDNEHFFEHCYK